MRRCRCKPCSVAAWCWPTPAERLGESFDFAALLLALASEAKVSHPHAWGDGVAETLRLIGLRLQPRENPGCVLASTARSGAAELWQATYPTLRRNAPSVCRDKLPEWFGANTGVTETPALSLARLPSGYVVMFGRAPVVVAGDRRNIARDVSSRYAPLLHYAAFDLAAALDGARTVAGPVFLLADDVWPPNYSHFLLDWLPRLDVLARSGWGAGAVLLTSPLEAPYQREALRHCDWGPERIIEMAPGQAVRAGAVLATTDQPQPPHPLFKGAAWAARELCGQFGIAAPFRRADLSSGRRLYLSRGDAVGRRVLNPAEFSAMLARRGFESVSLTGMTVAEQAKMFDAAAWIVAPHGAGLANLVFCRPGTTVLEIFPHSYGTPAFANLAAAMRLRYACHIVPEHAIVRGPERRDDDLSVDPAHLERRYADFLPPLPPSRRHGPIGV